MYFIEPVKSIAQASGPVRQAADLKGKEKLMTKQEKGEAKVEGIPILAMQDVQFSDPLTVH